MANLISITIFIVILCISAIEINTVIKSLPPLNASISRNLNDAYKAKVKDAKLTEMILLSIYPQDTRIALFIDEITTIKIYLTKKKLQYLYLLQLGNVRCPK